MSRFIVMTDDHDIDYQIELYHLGWGDHKRGEIRPSHYPLRAAGWDARAIATQVRPVMPERPEGYYHFSLGEDL